MKQRLLALYLTNLDPLRVALLLISLLWASVLLAAPEKTTAQWPIWNTHVWGVLWLAYGSVKAVMLARLGNTWFEVGGNALGVFVMSAWVYAFWVTGTYPPAPTACLIMGFWLAARSGRA